MTGEVVPGQLVTLGEASTRLDKPVDYFRTRRRRYAASTRHPFPQPVDTLGGRDVYAFIDLVVWDEKRARLPHPRRVDNETKETQSHDD